nr:hypothetical protein [Streptomyces spinosus]
MGQSSGHLCLRQTDGLGDLLLGPLLVKAQVQNAALDFRQLPDGGRQGHHVDHVVEARSHGACHGGRGLGDAGRCIERQQSALLHGTQCVPDQGRVHAGVRHNLLHGGRQAAASLFQLFHGAEHRPTRLLQGSRHPDHRCLIPKVQSHLADDGGQRIGKEGMPPRRVESVHGLRQADGGNL